MNDIDVMKLSFMARSEREVHYAATGQLLAMSIMEGGLSPQQSLRAHHGLRVAARFCPAAAYVLAGLFSEKLGAARPRRKKLYLSLLKTTLCLGLERLGDSSLPYERSPPEEEELRDVISRAVTNIGVDFTQKRDYVSALPHFRLAVRLYPKNANAQLCLGRMCVFHHEATEADPLEGHAAWKVASQTQPSCLNNESSCGCLSDLVAAVDGVMSRYGDDEARRYLVTRVGPRHDQSAGKAFKLVVASPDELEDVGVKTLGRNASEAAKVLSTLAAAMGSSVRLETRVTIAASLLGRLALVGGRRTADIQLFRSTIERCAGFEPLRPLLGDHEWRDVSPPETLHLQETETIRDITSRVELMAECLEQSVPGISPEDAMAGLLFHLDPNFRNAICYMAKSLFENFWDADRLTSTYNPAMHIQGP